MRFSLSRRRRVGDVRRWITIGPIELLPPVIGAGVGADVGGDVHCFLVRERARLVERHVVAVRTRAIPAPTLYDRFPHSGGATGVPWPSGPWHLAQVEP